MKQIPAFTFLLALAAGALAAPPAASENERVARRVFDEILSQGRFDLATELYAPDFVNHGRSREVGLEEDQAAARGWKSAVPDMILAVELTVSEGDRVAVLWRGRGTNTGSGNGIPATGKRINGRGITIWQIDEGRVKEEWSEFSVAALLQQVGLAPGGEPLPADGGPVARAFPAAKQGVPSETLERNRKVVTSAFEEVLGSGPLELFDSIYAEEFVNHGAMRDGGATQQVDWIRELRSLVPELRVRVTHSIAEGDLVAVVYVGEGTHRAVTPNLAPHDKLFQARGMSIMRVNGEGKITDEWSVFDRSQLPESPLPASAQSGDSK